MESNPLWIFWVGVSLSCAHPSATGSLRASHAWEGRGDGLAFLLCYSQHLEEPQLGWWG